MGENTKKRGSKLVWLLLLVAMVLVWIYFRPAQQQGVSDAELESDRLAALGADPDDILVDLKDSVSDADVKAIESQLGIDLVLVSDESYDERFYRAHVPAARPASLLAEISPHP